MIRVPNPELDRIILDALAEKYKLLEKREGIHLSTLLYCLTKGYLDLKSPIEPTDTELLLFATGYGLQEVMTPSSVDTPYYVEDGIMYRPDTVFPAKIGDVERLVEMKSTRVGVKRYREGDLPETWMTYMKGGCYIRKTKSYDLAVIYVAERPAARIVSETIFFDEIEIEENWKWILKRRDVYKKSLEAETIPLPFMYCASWMCTYGPCRYINVCEAIQLMEENK